MVQNDNSTSSMDENNSQQSIVLNTAEGIATGRYGLVGWGIDTTGRRLIDEICQLAAYTATDQFAQYIMPYINLNSNYVRKHNIRVINSGRFRLLKDMSKNKFVKTKSAISALSDFVGWLEQVRGDRDGLILVYHEVHKSSPGLLLENLRRYDLVTRFAAVVKGFANGFSIAQIKCGTTMKSFSLRMMSKVLLNNENEDFSSAVDRARAAYEIVVHLGQELVEDTVAAQQQPNESIEFICPFTNSIEAEEREIADFKLLLERQNTFRPVFGAMLKASRVERQHATYLRRLLAENNMNYDKIKNAYETDAKDGLDKLLQSELVNAKENDLKELLNILDCFFDPEKEVIQPKPRYFKYSNNTNNNNKNNNRQNGRINNNNKNNNTTTSSNTSSNNGASKMNNVDGNLLSPNTNTNTSSTEDDKSTINLIDENLTDDGGKIIVIKSEMNENDKTLLTTTTTVQ